MIVLLYSNSFEDVCLRALTSVWYRTVCSFQPRKWFINNDKNAFPSRKKPNALTRWGQQMQYKKRPRSRCTERREVKGVLLSLLQQGALVLMCPRVQVSHGALCPRWRRDGLHCACTAFRARCHLHGCGASPSAHAERRAADAVEARGCACNLAVRARADGTCGSC